MVLVAIWLSSLFIGVCVQLNQIRHNWVEANRFSHSRNFVFERVLKILGVSQLDRLTCAIFIFNALLVWPLGVILGIPAIKMFRDRERNALAKGTADQLNLMREAPINTQPQAVSEHDLHIRSG